MINIRSSRELDKMTHTDTAFMYLAAMQHPDFRTICRFRSTHLDSIKDVFSQVVTVCKEMGMLGVGKISLDGTKIKANASVKQSKNADALDKEIDKILKESIEIDKAEDEMYGDSTPYQMPKELANKTKRLEKIKAAKKKLEDEKLEKINITDNDAKIMKHKDGSLKPSYNGQIAVDDKEQVIVAADLVTDTNDVNQIDPMIQLIWATMGYRPTILLADAGYFSYDNIDLLNQIGTDSYIPDNSFKVEERGKSKYFLKSMFRFDKENDCYYCPAGITMPFKWIQKRDDEPHLKQYIGDHYSICVLKNACTNAKKRIISRDPREHLMEEMRKRLRTKEGNELYQERMSTVEPVFGQMKQNRGFTEFLLRGKDKTKVEFILMCIVHNVEKIEGFLKRKAKDMKEVLRTGFSMDNLENIGEIMINCADKISFLGGIVVGSIFSNRIKSEVSFLLTF